MVIFKINNMSNTNSSAIGGGSVSGGVGGDGSTSSDCACGKTLSDDKIIDIIKENYDIYRYNTTWEIIHDTEFCVIGWICIICGEFNPIPNHTHGCEHKCGMGNHWCPDISNELTNMHNNPIKILLLYDKITKLRKELAQTKKDLQDLVKLNKRSSSIDYSSTDEV
jgi:hypothetical protein